MEAGSELESGGTPSDAGPSSLVETLLFEPETKLDMISTTKEIPVPSLEGSGEQIIKVAQSQQPVIRLAKSVPSVRSLVKTALPKSWRPSSVAPKESSDASSSIKILSPVGAPFSSSHKLPVKIIKGNETRQISLAQANELGLVLAAPGGSPIKTTQILKSPIKLTTSNSSASSVVSSAKIASNAIVIAPQGNNSGKKVILQPGADGQRFIRLPSGQSGSSSSNVIQLNNSKVQYVKVALPASKSQSIYPQSNDPIKVVSKGSVVHQRKILPARRLILPAGGVVPSSEPSQVPATGASPRYLPIAPLVEMKEEPKLVLENSPSLTSGVVPSNTTIEVSSGVRLRKPCNCSKSQCLKLYCDCFANGEFCYNCNCFNCFNNLEHEEDRQRSIRSCLERNPSAFRPKIGRGGTQSDGERVHHKGCNCKRSSCLKNYCECYEAKIPCTSACRCISCKNVEEPPLTQGGSSALDAPEPGMMNSHHHPVCSTASLTINSALGLPQGTIEASQNNGGCEEGSSLIEEHQNIIPLLKKEIKPSLKSRLTPFINPSQDVLSKGDKKSFNCVTNEVISATCQCLLTQAEEAERLELPESKIEALIIEEFGRCLKQIIDTSKRSKS